MSEWKPIEEYLESAGSIWDLRVVLLADDEGHEAAGDWSFEDENFDGDCWFDWHTPDGELLGFTPTKWRPLPPPPKPSQEE